MNAGIVLPGVWLGIAKAPMYGFSFGVAGLRVERVAELPAGADERGRVALRERHGRERVAPRRSTCSPSRARGTSFLNAFRPAIARGWSSVPVHLPPDDVAICPP